MRRNSTFPAWLPVPMITALWCPNAESAAVVHDLDAGDTAGTRGFALGIAVIRCSSRI